MHYSYGSSILQLILLILCAEQSVNGFSSLPRWHLSTLRQQRAFVSDVVVNAARRRRADDTSPTNTTDTTANPTLRGTRNRHFGQKKRTWMQSYEAFLEFKRLHPNRSVPAYYSRDRPLGRWVTHLRMNGRESLSSEQLKLLDEAGFDWETQAERNNRLWKESYQKLIEYKEVHGNCCVPRMYNDDKALGLWVFTQRRLHKQGRLRVDREEQLDAVGFSWSVRNAPDQINNEYADRRWNVTFDKLLEFREEFGHCLVPRHFEEDPSLATWVDHQRTNHRRGSLRRDRKDRLEEINFVFDPSNADENLEIRHWNSMFQHLVDYKDEHGDTNVKQRHEEFGLGRWVSTQRQKKSTMDEQRKQQLDDIGFQWTIRRPDTWQERFDELSEHCALHGTCKVKKKENPGLAQWVFNQKFRTKRGTLSEVQMEKLESIGFY